MELTFSPDEEKEFLSVKDVLLDEFERWATTSGFAEDILRDVSRFLEWRFYYSTGQLNYFAVHELEEYLLRWCPRQLSFPAEFWLDVVEGVKAWIDFLHATARWDGLLQPTTKRLSAIAEEFLEAMSNPNNFGITKGLFSDPTVVGSGVDMDDPEALSAVLDAFNELPFEERQAIVDPLRLGAEDSRTELSIGPYPSEDEVRQAAEAAPILAQLQATFAYLGDGKPLTKTGNAKLVDARALVEMWQTDDVCDSKIGDHEYKLRTSANLPHFRSLLDIFLEAKALQKRKGKLVPVKKWSSLSALEQLDQLLKAAFDLGPVTSRIYNYYYDHEVDVVEHSIGHWLVPMLYGEDVDVEKVCITIKEMLEQIVSEESLAYSPYINHTINSYVTYCLDILERCGLFQRHGTELVDHPYMKNQSTIVGGFLTVTAAGRWLLPKIIEPYGYAITSAGNVGELSAREFLEMFGRDSDIDEERMWSLWHPDKSDAEKALLLVEAIKAADHPVTRMNGFAILREHGIKVIGPAVRSLVGTHLETYALAILVEAGESIGDIELAGSPGVAPAVDLLAASFYHSPEELVVNWAHMIEGIHDSPTNFLGALSQSDYPEVTVVLDALGRYLPDKKLAREARKAAHKARTSHT